jgi:hypothetical protein
MSEAAETNPSSFSHQAAKGSWASGVIAIVLLGAGRSAAPAIVDLGALALIVTGIICVLLALLGIRKHGVRGILAPALLGLAINGFLAFIFVSNFLAARARALGE